MYFRPLSVNAKMSLNAGSRGKIKNASERSMTVKTLCWGVSLIKAAAGFGTGERGEVSLLIAFKSCTILYFPDGFKTERIGVFQEEFEFSKAPALRRPSIVSVIPSSACGDTGYCGMFTLLHCCT